MLNDSDVITRVWMLFDIIHKAASAGPTYTKWAQAAADALDKIELEFNGPKAIPSSTMETDDVEASS